MPDKPARELLAEIYAIIAEEYEDRPTGCIAPGTLVEIPFGEAPQTFCQSLRVLWDAEHMRFDPKTGRIETVPRVADYGTAVERECAPPPVFQMENINVGHVFGGEEIEDDGLRTAYPTNEELRARNAAAMAQERERVGRNLLECRVKLFKEGCVPRTAIEDNIVSVAELKALGWEQNPLTWDYYSPACMPEEKSNHDYHGPKGPEIDEHGYPTGKQVPVRDETHERFHKSVGDVIQGKVLPEAMDQMKGAIDAAKAAAPKTKAGIPPKALGFR